MNLEQDLSTIKIKEHDERFFFRPSAVGSRAGQKMKICEENDYSLSTTKELVLVYIRIPRCQGGPTAYIKALTGVVNKLIAAFMRYEI